MNQIEIRLYLPNLIDLEQQTQFCFVSKSIQSNFGLIYHDSENISARVWRKLTWATFRGGIEVLGNSCMIKT